MTIRNKHGEEIDNALHDVAGVDNKLVILGHGVTGDKDRDLMIQLSQQLAKHGWPTMRISFSGCGESEGKFEDSTINKEADDLLSIIDQVKGSKKIAYIGYSMGGAVGTIAAAKDDRISVLVNMAGMVRTNAFYEEEFGDLTPDKDCMWKNEDKPLSQAFATDLKQIDCVVDAAKEHRIPWLLLHGSSDNVVSPSDSELLFNNIKGKKLHTVIPGADHSFEDHWPELANHINDWLKVHF